MQVGGVLALAAPDAAGDGSAGERRGAAAVVPSGVDEGDLDRVRDGPDVVRRGVALRPKDGGDALLQNCTSFFLRRKTEIWKNKSKLQ